MSMTYTFDRTRPTRAEQRASLLRQLKTMRAAYCEGDLSEFMWESVKRQAKDLGITDQQFEDACHR